MAKIKGLNKGGLDKNQTELIWLDKKTEVERTILPFQAVENINEPKDKQRGLSTFIEPKKKEEWRNKLIWGDNKLIMSSLLPEFAGKIKLIYIDPPFDVGADFSFKTKIGNIELLKEQSVIEEKAYRDTWGKGTDSYLQMMYDRLVLMRELLTEDGSIWVHLDEHVGHYARVLLDEIFGKENFLNDIIWWYPDNFQGNVNRYANNHNTILVYSKKSGKKLERQKIKLDKPTKRDIRIWDKEKGKVVAKRDSEGKIVYETFTHKYSDDVWQIGQSSVSKEQSKEYLGYPTQKPEKLLERVILSASNEGDLIADFFCGSGTTFAIAERLGRKWIGADLGKFAIHVTRKRILNIPRCKPFEVLNLGNYQRHKFKEKGKDTVSQYIRFILDMYRAQPISGHQYIHGKKANRLVHIGAVDSMITEKEIRNCMEEAKSIGSKAIDVLGWDFEMGLHDTFTQVIAKNEKMDIKLVQIPKEALEVKDAIKEEVKFFEMPYLDVKHKVDSKKLSLDINDFVIKNTEYIPEDVQNNIKEYTDLIDYWAVDWDFKDDTFHNQWQSFRTKKEPNLDTKTAHTYSQKGNYKVLVKIIDIFGNDTNKLIEIKIK